MTFCFKFLKIKLISKNDEINKNFSNLQEFQKYKKIKPKKVDEIYRLRDYVSLKLISLGI